MLHTLDYVVVAAYLLVVVGFSLFASNVSSTTMIGLVLDTAGSLYAGALVLLVGSAVLAVLVFGEFDYDRQAVAAQVPADHRR